MLPETIIASFEEVRPIDSIGENILQKRYYNANLAETSWAQVAERVIDWVVPAGAWWKDAARDMLMYRYFIPNSPCLVNAGKIGGGLSACFVVDFPDSIQGIYKTKLDFALIAKKGGGCGTTLSHIRPENDPVQGSTHGYAGGPVKFFDTICHDMKAMTQAGFREMAMLGAMDYRHPDIMKFIRAKSEEGKMHTTNISVVVDGEFMRLVDADGSYWTEFGGKKYTELKAREVFSEIVDGAWRNGEPGLLFSDRINDNTPYRYSRQTIYAANPCGEQPLPPNGVCNLGSIDVSKFLSDGAVDWGKLEIATRVSARFLDAVIDAGWYPTEDIETWALDNRPIGIGVMGVADLLLFMGIPYGSQESFDLVEDIMRHVYLWAENESVKMGEELGVPLSCQNLPAPRRNATLISIAPTGTISLLAGCSNGIEPIFSEFTLRQDKTGTYKIEHPYAHLPHFRCAVSGNGGTEVTWQEHVQMQNVASRWCDSGVSKTINFPNNATRDDIANAFKLAYNLGDIKGITVYRNGSRQVEVLSPKLINKEKKCPECGGKLVKEGGCTHCDSCEYSFCEIG